MLVNILVSLRCRFHVNWVIYFYFYFENSKIIESILFLAKDNRFTLFYLYLSYFIHHPLNTISNKWTKWMENEFKCLGNYIPAPQKYNQWIINNYYYNIYGGRMRKPHNEFNCLGNYHTITKILLLDHK